MISATELGITPETVRSEALFGGTLGIDPVIGISDESAMERLLQCRDEATNNKVWEAHTHRMKVTNEYAENKLWEHSDAKPGEAKALRLAFNLLPAVEDQLVGTIGSGMVRTVMETPERWARPLVDEIGRDIHLASQQRANLLGRHLGRTRDSLRIGSGGTRWGFKLGRNPLLPDIRGERMVGTTWWVSPYADDPYDRLLGSPYLAHETVRTRRELMMLYPHKLREIDKLEGHQQQRDVQADDADPVKYYLDRGQTSTTNIAPWYQPKPRKRDYERLIQIEFVWKDWVRRSTPTGFGGVEYSDEIWWRMVAAFPINKVKQDAGVVLECSPIRFGEPHFSLHGSWIRSSSPYGLGPLERLWDLNLMLSTQLTQIMAVSSHVARMNRSLFVDPDIMNKDDMQQVARGDGPPMVRMKSRYRAMSTLMHMPNLPWPNFTELAHSTQMLLSLKDTIAGTEGLERGQVSESSRLPGSAVRDLMGAAMASLETPRNHGDAALTHDGEIIWQLLQHYYTIPFRSSEVGGRLGARVNERLPLSQVSRVDEMADALEQDEDVTDEQGLPYIPNGVRALRRDGGEEQYPADFTQREEAAGLIRALQQREDIENVEIAINDITRLQPVITMWVDHAWAERKQERVAGLSIMTGNNPREIDLKTRLEWVTGDDPGVDIDEIMNRSRGEGIAAKVAEFLGGMKDDQQREEFEAVIAQQMQVQMQTQAAQQA